MYYAIGVSVPSLHRESTDSLKTKYTEEELLEVCGPQVAEELTISASLKNQRTLILALVIV